MPDGYTDPTMNVQSIQPGTKVTVKIGGEIKIATYVDFATKYGLARVDIDGRRILRKIYSVVDGQSTQVNRSGLAGLLSGHQASAVTTVLVRNVDEDADAEVAPLPTVRQFHINDRFDFLSRLVRMVGGKKSNSLVVSGSGGLGKSFTVRQALEGVITTDDYVVIKGFATPKSLYRALYENSEKLVIFDDCDSVLQDPKAVNILKAALDSEKVRTISWLTEAAATDESLPNKFDFTGQVIFITNLDKSRVPQPLLSRAQLIDVGMTADEKIERMRALVSDIRPDIEVGIKNEVIDHIYSFRHVCKDLNFRSLLKALEIRQAEPTVWRDIVEYSICAQG